MWKKMFRTRQSLNYRKKYRCPICNDYSFHVIHDKASECENSCDVDCSNIDIIMHCDDYKGYYTLQEINDKFWCIDDECNELLKRTRLGKSPSLFSRKEEEKINILFEKAFKFDEQLDDIVVIHFNNSEDNDLTLSPFGYLINLIEDTHFFINLCCKDIVLFNYGVELAPQHFYSGRFFYNNAVEHLFQVHERIYVLLAIFYGYSFKEDLSLNKTGNIIQYLKECQSYKNSEIKVILDKINGNNLFSELKEIRQSNDHDLSYLAKLIKEDVNRPNNDNFDYWYRDGNEVDKDLYLPKIKNLIFSISEIYNLMDQFLTLIRSQENIYSDLSIPMIDKFIKFNDSIKIKEYSLDDFNNISKCKVSLFNKLQNYKGLMVKDIFFRLDETTHCIADVHNLATGRYYSFWYAKGVFQLESLIDTQYLLYSSIFRVYACYDKIARQLGSMFNGYNSVDYFDNLRNNTNNSALTSKIKGILESEYYELLIRLRNDIYHNLRAGCLHGKEGLEYYNTILFQVIFENVIMIFDILDFMHEIKMKKLGRNDLCSCGSGKKYKNCCLSLDIY